MALTDIQIRRAKPQENKQLQPITSHYPYIFIGRNNRSKPISKETISQVIELLGDKERATGHGFRHTMSTILHEHGFDSAWIELQLAHIDKNSNRGTYNHASYYIKIKEMMQWYANYIYNKNEFLKKIRMRHGNQRKNRYL